MNRLPVVWKRNAAQDLKDIHDWIASASGHPQIAADFVDRLFTFGESLAYFPMKGRARNDLQPGLRIIAFEGSAVLAYRIGADAIEVTNVFYAGRDYEAILRQER